MGASASNTENRDGKKEGEYFLKIAMRKSIIPESHNSKEKLNAPADARKDVSNGKVIITPRAKILMNIANEILWNNFLSSPANSFALTVSEASALLTESLKSTTEDGSAKQQDLVQAKEDIDSYMVLIKELSGSNSHIDFMSIFSSTLFLSRLAF